MVTIKDVARLAGVSPATVSAVLNNSAFVSPPLRQRVERAIRSLNYHPNALARGLKTRRTHTIALLVSDIRNPFYTGLVRGVEDVAREHGYTVILGNSDRRPEKIQRYLATLVGRRVEGVILTHVVPRSHVEALRRQGLQVVFVDVRPRDLYADAVVVNNVEAAWGAVRHLVAHGRRRVGILGFRSGLSTGDERLVGYRRALEEAGVQPTGLVVLSRLALEHAQEAARELLRRRPDAVFAANNTMVLAILRTARELGLRIPEDCALVGFDDVEWMSVAEPPVTTVAQPMYELGAAAARCLLDRLREGRDRESRLTVLHADLVVRRSCGCEG
ncbi:MAG: LacI family DNA-binding transcriptional regulator [Armatimonadota bacterium]|nr:LacI family DNA-binding transcriptional regulator [Armatimonadota bacterium]MDR7438370.1 LacI family DNA-binding transcriptional regulator [Armatimonadota bacterium]MDR7563364.1 LacI family DNA-binding transcriptional regulator [Armatimonadota bacterium]MDR7568938.1 LacI family DNA-binding transcriptional regulator [Armatimonadota bacterium]MDR7602414.1 LacI family DNA-binding transcriptional regulator [Armatimonadota bacterium]